MLGSVVAMLRRGVPGVKPLDACGPSGPLAFVAVWLASLLGVVLSSYAARRGCTHPLLAARRPRREGMMLRGA